MKDIKNKIFYFLGILFPIIAVCIFLYLLYFTKNNLVFFRGELIIKEKSKTIIIFLFIFSLFFYLLGNFLRINYREKIIYDKNGKYKNIRIGKLSRKDRDRIAKETFINEEMLFGSGFLQRITHKGTKNPTEKLDSLIGLVSVKKEIKKLEARMQYSKKDKEKPSMHMCFLGNPGTGKTTVARIMTSFLYQNKFIKENKCIEIDGNTVKGSSSGETNKKLNLLLDKAKHGVLFIDEAYSLMYGAYSKEIIATILKRMEDEKTSFVLILAGYKNEMENLINTNPGFKSRIRHFLNFPDYDLPQLLEIFRILCNSKGFYVSEEAMEKYETKIEKERKTKNFGNARTVRNDFEDTIDEHAYNYINGIIPKDKKNIICKEDIIL